MDISLIWAVLIAIGVLLYIVLDGFDLGVGVLFAIYKEEHDRDIMVNSIAPVWDGNETWLIFGGAALFAAFPIVYSVALSALYLPIVFMLVCLIFRGAAIELRNRTQRYKHFWDLSFFIGSTGSALFQGIILGAWISGIPIENSEYAGDPFDWLTPFSIFTGFGVVFTYALLGCGWLLYRTEGELQKRLFNLALPLNTILLIIIAAVSIWSPIQMPTLVDRWFTLPNLFMFSPVPLLVAATWLGMRYAIKKQHHLMPFLMTLALVVLGYAGLIISIWPNVIPPALTFWDAAAPRSSQLFALVGVAIVLPAVVAYTIYAYWVFRGKVKANDGYH